MTHMQLHTPRKANTLEVTLSGSCYSYNVQHSVHVHWDNTLSATVEYITLVYTCSNKII